MSRGKPSAAGRRRRYSDRPTPKSRAPRPPDRRETQVLNRADRSHVTGDGTPKQILTAEQARQLGQMYGLVAYLCWQAPEHYHVGNARFDAR